VVDQRATAVQAVERRAELLLAQTGLQPVVPQAGEVQREDVVGAVGPRDRVRAAEQVPGRDDARAVESGAKEPQQRDVGVLGVDRGDGLLEGAAAHDRRGQEGQPVVVVLVQRGGGGVALRRLRRGRA
jgi:hypothetical protein